MPTKQSDTLEKKVEFYRDKSKAAFFKIVHLLKTLGFNIAGYMFLSFIFWGIYNNLGFEFTLIILLIGVFYYGIKGIMLMEIVNYDRRKKG